MVNAGSSTRTESRPAGTTTGNGSSAEPAVLAVQGIGVSFGGVRALDGVDISATASHVTGLIGPNGAGKTTLFNVICGLQEPNEGRVTIDGEDVTRTRPHRRARMGLARTFQRLEAFGSLTARENVLVAAEIRKRWARDPSVPTDVTNEILDQVGITHIADERVDALPTGMARLVEVGRALATRPKLLLLDEPGSGLNEEETNALGELLTALAADGLAVLLVEHDVDLVMKTSDIVHVLDFGKIIGVGTPREVQKMPAVQAAYLGTTE